MTTHSEPLLRSPVEFAAFIAFAAVAVLFVIAPPALNVPPRLGLVMGRDIRSHRRVSIQPGNASNSIPSAALSSSPILHREGGSRRIRICFSAKGSDGSSLTYRDLRKPGLQPDGNFCAVPQAVAVILYCTASA